MIPVAAVKANRGFTLIELLVVMAIIAIAASLIGPVALNQYERSKATAEREALLRLLDHYRFQAYSQNRAYTITTTTTNQLIIQKGQPPLDKWGGQCWRGVERGGGVRVFEFSTAAAGVESAWLLGAGYGALARR